MLSPTLCAHYCNYADDLMKYFVDQFKTLYGAEELVYNVHCLCHLAEDVRRFGPLDRVSAFPFENFMSHLKRQIRKPQHILKQIGNARQRQHKFKTSEPKYNRDKPKLGGMHSRGPTTSTMDSCIQYNRAILDNFSIKCKTGDNCVKIDGQIGLTENILFDSATKQTFVLFRKFLNLAPLYTEPLNSQEIGIHTARELDSETTLYPLSEIEMKYVLLPFESGWAAIPMLHT